MLMVLLLAKIPAHHTVTPVGEFFEMVRFQIWPGQ
jgi:hypothetical protein